MHTACNGTISRKTDEGYHSWQDVLTYRQQTDANFAKWANKSQWKQFANRGLHFDWWQFPWSITSNSYGTKFVLKYDDFIILLNNELFVENYIQGFNILIKSFNNGFDGIYKNHHPVRPTKIRCSLFLFWIIADVNNMTNLTTRFTHVDTKLMQAYEKTDAFKNIDCKEACQSVCTF